MSETQVAALPGLVTRSFPYAANPVLIKCDDTLEVSHFHLPGDYDYESVLSTVRELGERMRLSFEDAAKYLGYEVGFVSDFFHA